MNGAALPSMIGTSGEFSSISTLSMFMLTSAASRCSTVSTDTSLRARPVASWMPARCCTVAGTSQTAQVGPPEADAEVGRRGLQREVDLVAGMETDSDTRNLAAKGTLCVH